MAYKKVILITGGAGFIGSHVVRRFVNKYPDYMIINYDNLTYAGNLENLKDIENKENYKFIKGDIVDFGKVVELIKSCNVTDIIHLAAESHVDRSILGPSEFINTNIQGTFSLLEAARFCWNGEYDKHRFHHVSTDEVYGSLNIDYPNGLYIGGMTVYGNKFFDENTKYNPHSPYSASKASSDHLVKAYHDTYGMNVTISNCSNNYGPNQFPEKLIPLAIDKLENGEKIPVYGSGMNVRDWLHVQDHAAAIDTIFSFGKSGETYNVGGNSEKTNISLLKSLIKAWDELKGNKEPTDFLNVSEFVSDRKGHDARYAINHSKLTTELGWKPMHTFESGIKETVKWYLDNKEWCEHIKTGEYANWIKKNYEDRNYK